MKRLLYSSNSSSELCLSVGPRGLLLEIGKRRTTPIRHYFDALPEGIVAAHETLARVSAYSSWDVEVLVQNNGSGLAGFRAKDRLDQDGCDITFYECSEQFSYAKLCEHVLRRIVFVDDLINSVYYYFVGN